MFHLHTTRIILYFLLAAVIPAAGSPADTLPAIGERTAGMQEHDGFFPLYYENNTGKLFIEITTLDREFLYFNILVTGLGAERLASLDRGTTTDPAVVRFDRHGPRLLLIEQNSRFHALDTDNEYLKRSVDESFPVSVLGSFQIVAQTGDRYLVDGTDFFLRDRYDIGNRLRRAGFGDFRMDRDRSIIYMPATKSFPKNTEIQVMQTFASDNPSRQMSQHAPDGRSVTFRQHHSFVELPAPGYRPRKFDPRTGFFPVYYMDFSRGFDEEYQGRFIRRWRLEKKDPDAELSEPVKPITYYMDPGIPEPYYTAFKEGILWWNKAFEAAGFKNAVEVKALPEGADPMDARYSVVQWVHRSGPGPSVGPSLRDPRTGEILKANVRMDSHRSHVNYTQFRGYEPATAEYHQCGFMSFGIDEWITRYDENGTVTAQEYTMARRRQHAAHEVGHSLGLAHNFIASSYGRASVMDYPAPLLKLAGDGSIDLSDAYAPSIGAFDTLAIRYGYTQFATPEEEEKGLKEIVRWGLERGYRFLTGGDAGATGSVPQASTWVNGENMVDELERILGIRSVMLDRFSERAVDRGEPVWALQERFSQVYFYHMQTVNAAIKTIGGMDWTYAFAGDGQTPYEIVQPESQRRALDIVLRVLRPDYLRVPDRITNTLVASPYGYADENRTVMNTAGPAFDPLTAAQAVAQSVVNDLLHRERAQRLASFNARNSDYPSLYEVMSELIDRTWTPEQPRVRELGILQKVSQRAVIDGLINLASDRDATIVVRSTAALKLRELDTKLSGMRARSPEHKAHIEQVSRDIRRFFEEPMEPSRPATVPRLGPF